MSMLSRRVFVKNGGLALLSLGFAPAFLARTVDVGGFLGTVLGALVISVITTLVELVLRPSQQVSPVEKG